MAFKTINEFPENNSPSGEWFVLVDDGTGCYYKVKLKNLPGGGFITTSTTTTAAPGTTTTTTTAAAGTTTTTTTATPGSTTTSTTTTIAGSTTTSSTTTVVYDPDAQAFFTAAGITNSGQKAAVNNMVLALKSDGLWSEMLCIYPFVGGAATPHRYNLVNPANYLITFNGGVTHNANGVIYDGGSGYGDTGFTIANFAALNNMSYGVYIRDIKTSGLGNADIGVYSPSGLQRSALYAASGFFYPNDVYIPQWINTDGQPIGFIAASINSTAPNDTKAYKNGVQVSMGTTTNIYPASNATPWYMGAVNNNSNVPTDFGPRNHALVYFSNKLSGAQMLSFYNIVQAYQTALSRQV